MLCVQYQTPAWLVWRWITGGLLISAERSGTSVNPHNRARLLVCPEKRSWPLWLIIFSFHHLHTVNPVNLRRGCMSDILIVTDVWLSFIQAFFISLHPHFPPASSYPHVCEAISGGDAQVRSWRSFSCWAELNLDTTSSISFLYPVFVSLWKTLPTLSQHLPHIETSLSILLNVCETAVHHWDRLQKISVICHCHPALITCFPHRQITLWFLMSGSPTQTNNKAPPQKKSVVLYGLLEFLLVSLFPSCSETKPTGPLLIRNMQIHLLISYTESLRLSLNTWLALILAWYSSRTPQVTEVNCSPRADSQLSYSDCVFP